MSENNTPENDPEVSDDDLPLAKFTPWTVKGLPLHMRNEVIRAAKAQRETVAEYIWAAHEVRKSSWQNPAQHAATEVIPWDDRRGRHDDPHPATGEPSLVELFDIICKFASTEPAPGNKALLNDARSVLYARLREARDRVEPTTEKGKAKKPAALPRR